uniref:Uncharacterized protein LOC100375291 n=1 Tax=Saccoglossus kowalevskii TaxID=10224 RepID=A0ABM0MQI8_SACKO|nr:PREDICTED: uncharacterized protein LOC100375291 [Saccoglossus kowalevskii]
MYRCDRVSAVPRSVKKSMDLSDFYEKYTHAYGVPIISSKEVPDKAIRRACYVVQVMLADRQDIRDSVYNSYGRIGIIGFLQNTTDVPEHDFLDEYYNTRARGLGGTMYAPISTAGEENILCYPKDSYHDEDILVHEFAHGIHRLGLEPIDDTFTPKLLASFEDARNRGLWNHTYAATNSQEYLAKGVQIYFNVNGVPFKGIDNQVNTRAKLRRYDRKLYKLVREIFPCGNEIIDRCFHAECSDQDVEENCRIWKGDNECETNPKYMITHCKRTCNICDFGGRGYPGDKPHMNCQSDQNSTPQLKLNKVKKVNNKKSKNRKNNLTKASDTFKEVSNTIKLSNKLEHQQGQTGKPQRR